MSGLEDAARDARAAAEVSIDPAVHATANMRYEDVPTATVFEGHDGIKRMCEGAHNWSSDVESTVLTGQTNGTLFAVETEWRETNTAAIGDLPATGQRFTVRMLSVGTIDDHGLVAEHRDYWDYAGFLAQIGAGRASR
jgi:hypothetical protein